MDSKDVGSIPSTDPVETAGDAMRTPASVSFAFNVLSLSSLCTGSGTEISVVGDEEEAQMAAFETTSGPGPKRFSGPAVCCSNSQR
jgi:hypothetical protein